MAVLHRFVRGLLRLGLKAFFRELEVRGADLLPAEGPLVIAANHPNSLMDPFLLLAALDRPICFLAKAPLFEKPVLGWFLRGLRCIPAHRKQDEGYAKEKNEGLYEAAAEVLSRGPALGIFPEGKSHSEPQLAEFRHGAARIALETEMRRGGVRVQLVGIHFEQSRGFRGKALLNLGPPVEVASYRERYAAEPRETTAALTADLQSRLSERVLEADNREILELADLLARMRALETGTPDDLPEAFDRKKRILAGYRTLRERVPAEVEALRTDLRRYRAMLDLLGVREELVAADYRFGRVAAYAARNTFLLALGLPLMALGLAAGFVPYLGSWIVSRFWSRDADSRAGMGFLAALVLFPAWWGALSWAGLFWRGVPGFLAVLAASPLAGLFALYWMDRWHRVLGQTWGLWMAIALPSARALLRRMRRRALGRAERLLAQLPATTDSA
jgi:1-acyl-sn-glycerol-3-phosphate acyltransferase